MKRAIIFISIFLVILLLVLFKIFSDKAREKQSAAGVNANPLVPVEAVIVRDTTVEFRFVTVGTILANESVAIVSEINRKVVTIHMKEGSLVEKDQLLFKLDDADIVARINKLTVEEKLASENEVREKALLAKGGISQERYDMVSNRLNTLRAEIAVLRVDLSKTEIRAPFAGKIGLRSVSEGALVNPGIILASLQDISRVKIDFAIPERYAGDLRAGEKVIFTTDYAPEPFTATVEALEPSIDLSTRTIRMRAICENRGGRLVPGASVKVDLKLRSAEKSLFVPTSALIPSVKGYSIFLSKSGRAVRVPVKTGLRNRESVQVLDGILPGDTLVVTNLLRVRKDSPLKIVKLK
ncbi:MAG: efflux RND transporter periplasmic adaptor subunit [bacterium]